MEMAEQYRMGKNKEIFFVKQQEKRSRKIFFFCFEQFFFGPKLCSSQYTQPAH